MKQTGCLDQTGLLLVHFSAVCIKAWTSSMFLASKRTSGSWSGRLPRLITRSRPSSIMSAGRDDIARQASSLARATSVAAAIVGALPYQVLRSHAPPSRQRTSKVPSSQEIANGRSHQASSSASLRSSFGVLSKSGGRSGSSGSSASSAALPFNACCSSCQLRYPAALAPCSRASAWDIPPALAEDLADALILATSVAVGSCLLNLDSVGR